MQSILLVDDSGFFREIGAQIESRLPAASLTRAAAFEALTVARKERPDLIFLDAEMTSRGSTSARSSGRLAPHTPVLVVAGGKYQEEEIRRTGANEWLEKPLDEAVLLESVRRHLRLQPRAGNRSAVGWPVTFWRDGAQHDGTLRDLSRGGFFILTTVRQPVGARLEIFFEVPVGKPGRTVGPRPLSCARGARSDPGLGCRFFRITGGPRLHLEDCLKTLEQRSNV
jgi:CheY-like chemotaxis protein